jgi:glycosyltransferase involved in cell wall biosynthesis
MLGPNFREGPGNTPPRFAKIRPDFVRELVIYRGCPSGGPSFMTDPVVTPPQRIPVKIMPTSCVDNRSISVVTVCLNARADLQKTINSVLEQNYSQFEYLVFDGGSSDGTLDVIQANVERLSYWQSKPDLGVYHAMNDSVVRCSGDWVLFMNAGDTFSTADSLSRMFRNVPKNADIVYGHHLYASEGKQEYRAAADFESTWTRLQKGKLGFDWLAGIPGHQATAVRKVLLERLKFDTNFRIAADHDLLFRARRCGAKFFNCEETISVYAAGGFSAKHYDQCKMEWRDVAERHGHAKRARKFYTKLERAEAEWKAVDFARGVELVSGFGPPEGPYENEKLPAFRRMLCSRARMKVARERGNWLCLKMATFRAEQVVITASVADTEICKISIHPLGRRKRFRHVLIDVSQASSNNEIELICAKETGESSQPAGVILQDYRLKRRLSLGEKIRRLLDAFDERPS